MAAILETYLVVSQTPIVVTEDGISTSYSPGSRFEALSNNLSIIRLLELGKIILSSGALQTGPVVISTGPAGPAGPAGPPSPPSGAATGDLAANYPNPEVAAITALEAGALDNVIKNDGAGGWVVGAAPGGGGPGSDTTAIHNNVASEISAIAVKATPTGADFLLIENAAAGNAKAHVLISSLPGGGAAAGIPASTIGAGGTYSTVKNALDAGEISGVLLSNVVELFNATINQNFTLYGNDFNWDMADKVFNYGTTEKFRVVDCNILRKGLIAGEYGFQTAIVHPNPRPTLVLEGCKFINDSAVANCALAQGAVRQHIDDTHIDVIGSSSNNGLEVGADNDFSLTDLLFTTSVGTITGDILKSVATASENYQQVSNNITFRTIKATGSTVTVDLSGAIHAQNKCWNYSINSLTNNVKPGGSLDGLKVTGLSSIILDLVGTKLLSNVDMVSANGSMFNNVSAQSVITNIRTPGSSFSALSAAGSKISNVYGNLAVSGNAGPDLSFSNCDFTNFFANVLGLRWTLTGCRFVNNSTIIGADSVYTNCIFPNTVTLNSACKARFITCQFVNVVVNLGAKSTFDDCSFSGTFTNNDGTDTVISNSKNTSEEKWVNNNGHTSYKRKQLAAGAALTTIFIDGTAKEFDLLDDQVLNCKITVGGVNLVSGKFVSWEYDRIFSRNAAAAAVLSGGAIAAATPNKVDVGTSNAKLTVTANGNTIRLAVLNDTATIMAYAAKVEFNSMIEAI